MCLPQSHMTRTPWGKATQQSSVDSLRVPSHQQPPSEPECVTYCLWMVSQYVANEYPDRSIRTKTRAPTIDEIQDFIQTDELGWKPNQDDLTSLSSLVSSVKFNLEYTFGQPPRKLNTVVNNSLNNYLPTIAFIDQLLLEEGTRGEGPLHAVVLSGANEQRTVVLDPWMQQSKEVKNTKLEDAWDPDYNQVIEISLSVDSDIETEGRQ